MLARMPHLHQQLRSGAITEWRATVVVREVAALTDTDHITAADAALCADPATLLGLGNGQVAALAAGVATGFDAGAKVRRAAKARSDRRVTSRPAPDAMVTVSTLLPVVEGVAMVATLRRDAVAIVAAGDPAERTRTQIEADLMFERVTGVSAATGPPVEVGVVISDRALFTGADDTAAHIRGYGPIPSAIARVLISDALTPTQAQAAEVTLRRIYASPTSGALTQLESVSRIFPKSLARLIDIRDRTCRTPWCDAAILHHDHIRGWGKGRNGKTTADNGDGLCAACNYAKEADGWSASTPADAAADDIDSDAAGFDSGADSGADVTEIEYIAIGADQIAAATARAAATAGEGAATADGLGADEVSADEVSADEVSADSADEVSEDGVVVDARDDRTRFGPAASGADLHEMTLTTPTGHEYTSTAPALPSTLERSGVENVATYLLGQTRVA